MITDVIYKVLWVDDQNKDEDNQLTEFYEGWQLKADKYNIELVPFDNWEEAEYSLRKDFDEYSAIILDANCKIHKNDTEQEEFITAVLPSLTNIFGEKRRVLPWYLLSAGTMSNFGKIVSGARYQHSKHEEDWGTMLYLKDSDESSGNAPSKLFENIARIAKDLAMNVVLYRHHDTFCYLGKDKLIDARARTLMLRMLSALYYPEDNIKYEYAGNPLRKVLEYTFRSARVKGLLPDECFNGDEVAVQLASLFMAGYNVRYEEDGIKKQIRWGNPSSDSKIKVGDAIFPQDITNLVNSIREYTNEESHTNEDEPWYIDEERKDSFFGHVLHMCYVIKWFGKYVSEHPNVAENKKMHQRINASCESKPINKDNATDKKPNVIIEDPKGKTFFVLNAGKFFYAGCCKLSSDCKKTLKVSDKIMILEAIENTDEDNAKYPFVAIKIKKLN